MFARLATLVLESEVRVVAGILAVVSLVGVLALPPAIEGDLMRLIPDEHPAVRALAAHREERGGEDILALTLPLDVDIEAVVRRVEQLRSVRSTFHGFTGELGLKLAILQLRPEQIEKLADDIDSAIASGDPALIEEPEIDNALFPWVVDPLPGLGEPPADELASQIVFVVPTAPAADPQFALGLLEDLERLVPEATFIAGPHADIGTAVREVRRDFMNTSLFSLLLVATIVALAFRNVAGLLILVPPLILANVLAISVVNLVFGSLNLYTSMGGAIVFGLGIDFGIHLVARFREELGKGLAAPDAVRSAWRVTGPPCLTAAVTSAAGFLAFLVAEFEGMRQLGFLLALGVMLNLATMLLVLPVMLTRIPLSSRAVAQRSATGRRTWPWTLAAIVLVSIVAAPSIPNIRFDYDISRIKSEGLAWMELTPDERSYRQNAFPPVFVRTDDRSGMHKHFEERIGRGDFDHVRGVVSLDSILPPDQDQRLEAFARLKESIHNPSLAFLPGSMRETLERIGNLDTEMVRPEDLPDGLAHLVGAPGDEVLLLLQGNMLDLRIAEALARELDEYKDLAASAFFVEAALGRVISTDLLRVAALTLVSVLLIIAADLKKPGLIAIAAGSLLLGFAWTAASLALLGVRINIVNVVAIPMLLGIGVDIVVHLLHRLRSGSLLGETLRTTGVAVLFSTLTTIAAFVSLTAAEHRGLQSIGLVVLIGLTAMLLAAVMIIATAWPFVEKSRSG